MYMGGGNEKAELNGGTHGVSFEETYDVFDGPSEVEEFDEERFRLIGLLSRR